MKKQSKTEKILSKLYWNQIYITLLILFIMFGSLLNFLVMMENSGKMPVKSDYYYIDYDDKSQHMFFQDNSEVSKPLLADQINLHGDMMYSVGDIIMISGFLLLVILEIYQGRLNWKYMKMVRKK